MNALILAGGLGTRLRKVVSDLPKPMAPVAGKPFLSHLLIDLSKKGVKNVVLSVGYRSEAIIDCYGDEFAGISIDYSIEEKPLGTGGALKLAYDKFPCLREIPFLLLNGDTFFDVDIDTIYNVLNDKGADIIVSLKPMTNFDRYGSVILENESVVSFEEKKKVARGLINGGVYAVNPRIFSNYEFPKVFSFEKDLLERYLDKLRILGSIFDSYFIDIGVPEDYKRANIDFNK